MQSPDPIGHSHGIQEDEFPFRTRQIAERILVQGVDIVLHFGSWSRTERDEFRRRAVQSKANTVIHYVPTPVEEILTRLAARNAALPATAFRISEEMILEWVQVFEPPTDDELAASVT
ncbi:AAA family ATPase [Escherichia coli]|uniref:AAA family ATPase n=1 Tax=Escherichia coli TaxID=562 RepID=UPI0012FFCE40|nr:AAA family ATPase [Escherichia coli]